MGGPLPAVARRRDPRFLPAAGRAPRGGGGRVRQALTRFVDQEMQPGDLVAILCTGAGMGALQQFTADRRLLRAAIDRVRFNMIGRVGIASFQPLGQEPDMGPRPRPFPHQRQ